VIARDDYLRLTGDHSVTDLALWPAEGTDGTALVARLRTADPAIDAGEWRSSAELRRISLAIFDRSFAITHVLEAVAILVGLFGVASTYAAQALTRAREFGMLRHLGLDRRAVIAQLAIEATVGTVIAVAWGACLGLGIALVLIKRVNPQSFHWTMDVTVPWPLLAAVAATLVATAVVTAMVATRSASSGEPVAALRHEG
jgi:putative ABC transport system permease protein